ncbi:MAG: lipoyl(octanoyl) transferase LipB [Gammaproteobacteria bacterium]
MKTPPESPTRENLGLVEYEDALRIMQEFTDSRSEATRDRVLFLQHKPVYTLGLNGDPQHVLDAGNIPVINIDRGGQVTFHGPGQLVVYPLLDIRRLKLNVRKLVEALENTIIDTLAIYDISAKGHCDAPGVYTQSGDKIAALGLRIRRGCCYHGIAFNVAMDLEPFSRINPCGFRDLKVTQVSDLGGPADVDRVSDDLWPHLLKRLGYNNAA